MFHFYGKTFYEISNLEGEIVAISNLLKSQVNIFCSLVESSIFIIVINTLVIDMEGKSLLQNKIEPS